MKLPPLPFLLLLFFLPFAAFSARTPSQTTPLIRCPCTFSISRPSSDNTPFSIHILTSHNYPNPHRYHPLSRRNLTNADSSYQTSTTSYFYSAHISSNLPHGISINSVNKNFIITHVTHTRCPTLLEPDPVPIVRQNIVGGSTAAAPLQDYLAYLHNPLTGRSCTGTIIAPKWVVTAAHCQITRQHIAYLQGSHAKQGTPHAVLRVFSRQFVNNAQYDIALVQLVAPAQANYMRVSINPALPIAATAARVLGYGSVGFDTPNEGVQFGQLQQVDVPIVTHAECLAAYDMVSALFQVCAGYLGHGGCDSCQGDSGGPLIQYDESDRPVLVGIVSRGRRCGEARFPGIYIRVGAFETWMDGIVVGYVKANKTRGVLAVTRSSRGVFMNFVLPVVCVCVGLLAVGLVVIVVLRVRYRRRKKSFEEESVNDTGSTDGDFMKWRGVDDRSSTPVQSVSTSASPRPNVQRSDLPEGELLRRAKEGVEDNNVNFDGLPNGGGAVEAPGELPVVNGLGNENEFVVEGSPGSSMSSEVESDQQNVEGDAGRFPRTGNEGIDPDRDLIGARFGYRGTLF